ncbi:hypothetical protein GCM10027456_20800 [Kineosporia babensis]
MDGTPPQQAYDLTYLYPGADAWSAQGRKVDELNPLPAFVNRPPAPKQAATCLVRRALAKDARPECRKQLDGTQEPAVDPCPSGTTEPARGARA